MRVDFLADVENGLKMNNKLIINENIDLISRFAPYGKRLRYRRNSTIKNPYAVEYVYALTYKNKIFYIGRGTGKRMYSHEQEVRAGKIPHGNLALYIIIKDIIDKNEKITYKILQPDLIRRDSKKWEQFYIDKYGTQLTNIAGNKNATNTESRISITSRSSPTVANFCGKRGRKRKNWNYYKRARSPRGTTKCII